ncbi:xylulose 5-phosphate/phosphate translocator, chloroplastic-like [Dendrobium catenatum]|uniref:Xylulose 5-phosphate/phosphate translocator, chloroplastic n=1 Tax=Dendrobium catenatum TaxID=906689 RepID=A0A2I0VKA5_9ASPA|nr:xylulose 5-phosphate/phosphate translocator, chloroplastic-like [Dendrobium catenatum]XP_028556946.1 xylulose 5-phosphate/phosphate translocator, chloroplastic-like [Dendrobium catenatum]XP_028556947.1 xylulose 5-phosphate/phosphate translocator, chloroplastic-like [Dendrobium catenatum]XP_028556948.1 xylulose 5-phosphate/phosphate translocator, chloroplastic-like [Dendrobium catenatum]PKU63846.1 Xylulose 5-phosphate/phosphate translocator, chloroplastic [Dendrobium catenatum]
MLAFQAPRLHTHSFFRPKTHRPLIIANILVTHYEINRLMPKRSSSRTLLLGIPRAAPAPHPPPEDAGIDENTHEEGKVGRSEPPIELSIQSESKPLAEDLPKKTGTMKLAAVFGFWYLQNVIFNIYNKKTLNLFPYPWLLASFQLLVGSLWMAGLWASRIQPYPQVNRKFFVALLGPALFHTIGHISACVSFSKVAVSFTHVIKASEPVFSVIFSALFGQFYPIQVWLSVAPIVIGCALAAVTEVSFNAEGLWGALISNVGFVLRNIYSKKSLQDFKHVDGLNLYGWISILSLLYLFPVAVLVEGRHWVQGYRTATAAIASPSTFYAWVILSGVFYHLYNQSSYQALDAISPLSFSVGNTMKRIVVIVASVIAFRNPIRPLNALGSAIAILGTFLYSQATATSNSNKNNEPAKKTS